MCYCVSSNVAANQATAFAITDTKHYVPVITPATQDNAKLLQQLKSEFKRIIIWNKSKVSPQAQNQYLNILIDPNFKGINRLFMLSFEANAHWISHKRYFRPTVEIKDYNVMIDGRNIFDQSVKNYERKYNNIWKITNGHGDICQIILISKIITR